MDKKYKTDAVKIFRVVVNMSLIILLLSAVYIHFHPTHSFFGYRLFTVVSESMKPELSVGDMVIVNEDAHDIKVGDVVAFKTSESESSVVTHRVSIVSEKKRMVQTKGDANKNPDDAMVEQEQIIGKVVGHIPKIGLLLLATNTSSGFIAIILSITTLLLGSYFFSLLKGELRKQNNTTKYTEEE
ncbi:signal peptidase I [Niallia alba]|uniref:signal peptidase I n=1 Tax=Niallia alba TaxID=2729105 RepID=UPI0039A3BE4A